MWNGDAFCDDELNILECDYDGGDCCGPEANLNYCILCECHKVEPTTTEVAEFTNTSLLPSSTSTFLTELNN